ncbi:hypothetical protein [Nostoc sp. 'Peltigera membranacea cyanobiont' 210A]|uniref:hypothetical protein n=1 Tax=Nostoc sp. 'Peltigera membranacea cyanobiont' 210A TaxID=2014529 RepID=UPI00117BFA76|nr:hypothetical protein [Nostoc sp. 'Peltigera membranacea cyanobiont' 210A]
MNRRLYNNQPFVETAIYRVFVILRKTPKLESKLGFEKVKAHFACGKHQNEKANWSLNKSKLILLAENTKMRKQTGV